MERLDSTDEEESLSKEKFLSDIEESIRKAAITAGWLNTPNIAFDDQAPRQLLNTGESKKLEQMLFNLESGNPS